MASPQSSIVEKIFPLEVCPICAYSLHGLAGEGVCPECGNRYDSSELVLYGWARGEHANAINSRGMRFAFTLFPGFALFNFLPQWLMGDLNSKWVLLFLVCWGAVIAFAFFRRKQNDHPGGVQVRMSERGILQIDTVAALRSKPALAGTKRRPWQNLKIVELSPMNAGRLRVKLQNTLWGRVPWWWYATIAVDAELTCPGGDTTGVIDLIHGWISEGARQ